MAENLRGEGSAEGLVRGLLMIDPRYSAIIARTLDPVSAHDRRHKTDLLPTLHVFADNNLSVSATADALGVHRHTVEYRLRRIETVLGRSVRKGPDRLLVELALTARRALRRHG